MMKRLRHLSSDNRASVAVEMALVVPLLITLMFGGLEGAYYLWNEHIAIKAVRDGARFASRQPFTEDLCVDGFPEATKLQIRSVTRTGIIGATSSTPTKLPGWADTDAMTSITVTCNSATATGLYESMPDGAPIVTVSVNVPYRSLFSVLGFATGGLGLRATSQATVMGI